MDRSSREAQGFTLIELLVVISILALLVALLLPSLGRAREIVRFTVCRSNMRGVSSAWYGFAAAHEGRFPGYSQSSVEHWGPMWAQILNREWYHNNDYKVYPTSRYGDEPTCGPLLRFWSFWDEPTSPNALLHKKWTTCPNFRAWGDPYGDNNAWCRPWVANNYAVGGHYADMSWADYCKVLDNPRSVHPNYTFYRLGARLEKFKHTASKYLMWDAEATNDMDREGDDTDGVMVLNANRVKPPWCTSGAHWAFRHLLPTDRVQYQQKARGCALYIEGHAGPVNPNDKVWGAQFFHD